MEHSFVLAGISVPLDGTGYEFLLPPCSSLAMELLDEIPSQDLVCKSEEIGSLSIVKNRILVCRQIHFLTLKLFILISRIDGTVVKGLISF